MGALVFVNSTTDAVKCGKICRVKTGTKVSLYCHEDKMDSNGRCGFMVFGD